MSVEPRQNTTAHVQVLVLDPAPAVAAQGRHVRTSDGTTAFTIVHRTDRLANVVVVTDSEGREVAALSERISAAGRTIVVRRLGGAPVTVRPVSPSLDQRRWAVCVPGHAAEEITRVPAAGGWLFFSDGRMIGQTALHPEGGQHQVVVPRRQDAIPVLASILAIEQLTRYV